MTPVLSLTASDLERWLQDHDAPAYRRQQIWTWLARGTASFDAMKDLPKALRNALEAELRVTSLRPIAVSRADDGLTTKTLYELDGGHSVEAVVMRYSDRSTLCISSQAGCPIGCPFCATGKFPFGRNLKAHEIVEQARRPGSAWDQPAPHRGVDERTHPSHRAAGRGKNSRDSCDLPARRAR